MITEVGGTVGDIESLPFLEAIRQVRHDIGRDNCFYLHVSLVPYLAPSGELKTKPTQHSVAALRNIGIQPDALVCRVRPGDPGQAQGQALAVLRRRPRGGGRRRRTRRASTTSPRCCTARASTRTWCAGSGCRFRDVDWTRWDDLLERVHHPQQTVTVAIVGKYVDLPDAYLSVTEAVRAAGFAHRARVELRWVPSDECVTPGRRGGRAGRRRRRGHPGRLRRARHRGQDRRRPVRPGARHPDPGPVPGPAVHDDRGGPPPGRPGRAPTRWSSTPDAAHPVIATMADQEDIVAGKGDLGGTMRLGAYPADAGARARWSPRRTARTEVDERHRHRYEVNNAYRDALTKAGLHDQRHLAGRPAGRVRRAGPRTLHPFFVATQAHPELKSRPDPAAPAVRRRSSGRRWPTTTPTGCRSRWRRDGDAS